MLSKILILILIIFFYGCSDKELTEEEIEIKTPIIIEARNYINNEQWINAENILKKILIDKPQYTRAHLDLAIIYQQYLTNYINSIYHYNRYLELNPLSEKNIFINEQINNLNEELELSFYKNNNRTEETKETNVTNSTNFILKENPTKNIMKYRIKDGDTLSKIARKFYNDPMKYDIIVDANNNIENSEDIKIGQIIIIPE